jgi:NDP-sugar pyrophosphorylase family protein
VLVENGARVKRAILGDNVHIGAGEVVENVAVVCADLLQGKSPPAKALAGYISGSNFVVPLAE